MEEKEKIQQLQLIEQNLQQFLAQKQEQQAALIEINSALKELEGSEEIFRIIGNIMVKSDKEKTLKELEEKKEMLNIRIKSIEKQEESLKEKAKKLQEEVVKEMESKKGE